MGIQEIAAWAAAVILFLLVALHLLLAAGAPFGRLTWGGRQHARLSEAMRVVSSAAAFVLAFSAIAVLARAGVLTWFIGRSPTRVLTWVVVGILGLNTVGDLASRGVAARRAVGLLAALAMLATLLVAVAR